MASKELFRRRILLSKYLIPYSQRNYFQSISNLNHAESSSVSLVQYEKRVGLIDRYANIKSNICLPNLGNTWMLQLSRNASTATAAAVVEKQVLKDEEKLLTFEKEALSDQGSQKSIVLKAWSLLLGMIPDLRTVPALSREDCAKKLVHWKNEFKEALQQDWLGLKLLGADIRNCSRLLVKLAGGKSLARRDTAGIFRLVPVAVFIVIPFMELLLPSTFQLKMKQKVADYGTKEMPSKEMPTKTPSSDATPRGGGCSYILVVDGSYKFQAKNDRKPKRMAVGGYIIREDEMGNQTTISQYSALCIFGSDEYVDNNIAELAAIKMGVQRLGKRKDMKSVVVKTDSENGVRYLRKAKEDYRRNIEQVRRSRVFELEEGTLSTNETRKFGQLVAGIISNMERLLSSYTFQKRSRDEVKGAHQLAAREEQWLAKMYPNMEERLEEGYKIGNVYVDGRLMKKSYNELFLT